MKLIDKFFNTKKLDETIQELLSSLGENKLAVGILIVAILYFVISIVGREED